MDSITVRIHPDPGKLASAFKNKASQTNIRIGRLTDDLLDVIQRWVKKESPHKTGLFKSSIQKIKFGSGGIVFQEKGIAPYGDWVIDGRGPITAAPGKMLHFYINGKEFFRKSVGAAKGHKPFDKASSKMMPEINRKIDAFEKWLVEV
jgi:hypothetical protein